MIINNNDFNNNDIWYKQKHIFFKIRDPSWTAQKIEQFLTYTLAISKGDIAKDGENSQEVVKSMRIMYIYIYDMLFFRKSRLVKTSKFAHYMQ